MRNSDNRVRLIINQGSFLRFAAFEIKINSNWKLRLIVSGLLRGNNDSKRFRERLVYRPQDDKDSINYRRINSPIDPFGPFIHILLSFYLLLLNLWVIIKLHATCSGKSNRTQLNFVLINLALYTKWDECKFHCDYITWYCLKKRAY